MIIFTNNFFKETSTTQVNIIAFEIGKVFWNNMKDKPVKGNQSLMTWFAGFSTNHTAVIENMKVAKYKDEGFFDIGIFDPAYEVTSAMGYIFRAQLLQVDKPKGQKEQQKWDEVIYEFRAHIDPLLQSK